MDFNLRRLVLCLLPVLTTNSSFAADNDVAIPDRAVIEGDLAFGDEDRIAFEAPEGSELTVRLSSRDGLVPRVELTGPEGDFPLGTALERRGTDRQRVRRLRLPYAGTWKLVLVGEGALGTYRARVQIRLPRQFEGDVQLRADGRGSLSLGQAVARSRVDIRLRAMESAHPTPMLESWSSANLERPAPERVRGQGSTFRARFLVPERDPGPLAWVVRGEPFSTASVQVKVKEPRAGTARISLLGDPLGSAARIPREHPNPGMQEFLRPDRAALLQPGARTAGFTSFDRQGGNDDGWSGIGTWLSFRSDPTSPTGVELTILELEGAGILHRMHFAFRSSIPEPLGDPTAEDYSIRFYVDGATTPTFEYPIREFVEGNLPAFPFPIVADDIASSGGPYNNVPIPFSSSLRVATTDFPHYYDFQHVTYPEVPVGHRSYTLADDPEPVRQLMAAAGADPRPDPDLGRVEVTAHVPRSGESFALFERTGEGFVERIDFQVDPPSREALDELWFEIHYGAETEPRVRVPLGFLFGNGETFTDIDGLMFRMDADGGGSIHWPIPYADGIRVGVRREGSLAGIERVACRVFHRTTPYEGDFGLFHGEWRKEFTQTGEDFLLLERNGRGHVVAASCVIRSDARFARAWMEGDERLFLDGSQSPALHGTGTEEFFGWGWYDTPMDRLFHLPQHGYPLRESDGVVETTAMYRILFPDVFRFEKDIRFSFEHGPLNNWNADYEMAVFYYAKDEPGWILTDSFDPADPAERAARSHVAPQAVPVTLTSVYEGRTRPPALTDDGLELTVPGDLEFTVSVDPSNEGVVLRRRLDQFDYLGQTADVFVDGVFVGTWRTAKNNFTQRWLDDEFQLPAAVTSGRTSLRLKFTPRRHPWNVYHWEVHSRVTPR